MRVLVSAYTDHPIAWKISKCEDANPKGIKTITLYQDFFNQYRDYIEKDETGKIIGMWADYYDNDNPNIKSSNDLIDDCIISNENISEMKNKDSKYQKTLNEILANESTSNKEIYNIRKAIELKYVEYYAKITGFKNSKSLIEFCENTFKLMEIENKN